MSTGLGYAGLANSRDIAGMQDGTNRYLGEMSNTTNMRGQNITRELGLGNIGLGQQGLQRQEIRDANDFAIGTPAARDFLEPQNTSAIRSSRASPANRATAEATPSIAANTAKGLPRMGIGAGTVIEGAIVDKNVRIGRGARIVNDQGCETSADSDRFTVRDHVAVVPKDAVVPDGWLPEPSLAKA
jgi:hypothetical protein